MRLAYREALDCEIVRNAAVSPHRRNVSALSVAAKMKTMERADDLITVDVSAAQCRTQVRATVPIRVRNTVGAAPEYEAATNALDTDRSLPDFTAKKHRIPVVIGDAHL